MTYISLNKSAVHFILAILISFSFLSCNDDDNNSGREDSSTIFESIDATMNEWYLWNKDIPNINSSDYSSVNDYFEDLLVSQDRWSYIANLQDLLAYFENGTYTGYGLAFKYDNNNDLRVKLIFESSPLVTEGITRGWKLKQINGNIIADLTDDQILDELDKSSADFVFENDLGEIKEFSANQIELDQNSVLKREVVNYQGTKVAYLAFDSFIGSSEDDLNEVFDYFKTENAEELVLDLRYNGGGSTYISNQLASLITGNIYQGEIYSKTFHNNSKSGENFSEAFSDQTLAFGFNRIFVITTASTASASEMVINGLKPYLGNENVILIGSKTH